MKLLIAADHAGYELKNNLIQALKKQSTELEQQLNIEDFGPFSNDSVDYPDFADQVCKKLKTSETEINLSEFGILICGSAQGMAMRANKFSNIRGALVYSDETVQLSREHNNANVICIGSRFCDLETALRWINIFKKTPFAQGRHQTRIAKLSRITS